MRAALVFALVLAVPPALAGNPVPSTRVLVTGNGHGFQLFEQDAAAITELLDHPYRYLRKNPVNPDGDGIERRDLAYDTYFGIRAGTTAAWLGRNGAPSEFGYVAESNMIRAAKPAAGVFTESFFVAPFGYEGNALVMLLKVTNTGATAVPVTAYSIHNFKFDAAATNELVAFDTVTGSAAEMGNGGGALVYAPIGGADVSSCADDSFTTIAAGQGISAVHSCAGTDKKNAFSKDLGTLAPGASAWWGVALVFDANGDAAAARSRWAAFAAGRGAEQLYGAILAEFEAWRVTPPPGLSGAELAVWRQSETVLRMGQVRESAKNRGMLLAGLPPGIWHVGWVRDGTYATNALARSGHFAEARASLSFFLNANVGKYASFLNNVPYRISTVRYFGDGEEEADFSGQPTRNIEIDGWGMYLSSARHYVEASGDLAWLDERTTKGDTVYEAIDRGVADALAKNLERDGIAIADASIWEVHWGKREHFLYTTAAAARGFCDMAAIASRAGRTEDAARYQALHARVTGALNAFFVDHEGALAGSLQRLARGHDYTDGATVEAINWSLVDERVAKATLRRLERLATPAGGFSRVEGSTDTYDTNEWVLVDLRGSSAFRRAGNPVRGDELLAWVTEQARVNHDLIPELYNTHANAGPIGAYTGSTPMVGFGAGAYLLAQLDRAGLYEPSDCGVAATPGDNEQPTPMPTTDGGGCSTGGSAGAPLLALALVLIARRRRG